MMSKSEREAASTVISGRRCFDIIFTLFGNSWKWFFQKVTGEFFFRLEVEKPLFVVSFKVTAVSILYQFLFYLKSKTIIISFSMLKYQISHHIFGQILKSYQILSRNYFRPSFVCLFSLWFHLQISDIGFVFRNKYRKFDPFTIKCQ